MKFSKKLFKRLLTASLSVAMLTSTITSASVFASTGILAPSDQTIASMTTVRTQNLNGYMDHVGSAGGDVCEYTSETMIVKSNKDKDGAINKSNSTLAVSKAISLSTDPDSNVKNIFMFNLKSDAGNDKNGDHAFRVLMMKATDWTSTNQITAFEMDRSNALGMDSENGGWYTTLDPKGAYMEGQSDKTYRVVMILKKNGIDYIVDGKNIGSIEFGEKNKTWMETADKFYMWFIVDDKIGDSDKEVKYHLSDFICIKGAGSFVAEADGAVYGKGEKAVVNFSMPVANKDLKGVKVFESSTGNEVACTSEFVGEKLNVKIDGDLNSQAEYRIELPAYKDCVGNDLVNDNVYFNAPKLLSAATEVFTDDFTGYNTTDTIGGYDAYISENKEEVFKTKNVKFGDKVYAPKMWTLNSHSWSGIGSALLEPVTVDSRGTVLEMGVRAFNNWGTPTLLYRRLGKKYDTGVMTVEYDVSAKAMCVEPKAEYSTEYGYKENENLNSLNMILYNDELTIDNYVAGGEGFKYKDKGVTYIRDNKIFGIQDKKFAVYTNNTKVNGLYGASASVEKSLENVTAENWYKIKHTIDIDNDSIKTYIGTTDADMKLFGTNKLSDCGINEGDGIYGIGFSIDGYSYDTITYVDNVKVSHAGFDTANGVSAVRYSAGNDKNYGSSDSTDTLINKIAVAFTAVPDNLTKNNFSISDGSNSIDFEVEQDASATNTYVLSLKDYLTAKAQYTLNVTGVTFGGTETMADYNHTIKADKDGVFEVKPMKILVNDSEKSNGAICPLNKDDKVKASVEVINTTGLEKKVTLSMGMYKDYLLNEFDFRDVTLDGTTKKYENVSFELTAGDDAANITSVNAYLWDTLAAMKPYQDVCGISCTTQNAE